MFFVAHRTRTMNTFRTFEELSRILVFSAWKNVMCIFFVIYWLGFGGMNACFIFRATKENGYLCLCNNYFCF